MCAFIGTEARLLLIATVPIGLRYRQSYSQIYMLTHTPTHTRACTPACVHISRCCWMFVDCCLQFDSLAPSPTLASSVCSSTLPARGDASAQKLCQPNKCSVALLLCSRVRSSIDQATLEVIARQSSWQCARHRQPATCVCVCVTPLSTVLCGRPVQPVQAVQPAAHRGGLWQANGQHASLNLCHETIAR